MTVNIINYSKICRQRGSLSWLEIARKSKLIETSCYTHITTHNDWGKDRDMIAPSARLTLEGSGEREPANIKKHVRRRKAYSLLPSDKIKRSNGQIRAPSSPLERPRIRVCMNTHTLVLKGGQRDDLHHKEILPPPTTMHAPTHSIGPWPLYKEMRLTVISR